MGRPFLMIGIRHPASLASCLACSTMRGRVDVASVRKDSSAGIAKHGPMRSTAVPSLLVTMSSRPTPPCAIGSARCSAITGTLARSSVGVHCGMWRMVCSTVVSRSSCHRFAVATSGIHEPRAWCR